MSDTPAANPFNYHLELTPAQLKATHMALRWLLDSSDADDPRVRAAIEGVLAKLPGDEAMESVSLDEQPAREDGPEPEPPEPPASGPGPSAA